MNRPAVELETRRADAAARKSIRRPRRRLSPFALILAVAVVGSTGFLGYSFTQKLATMTAALATVGVVFVFVTLYGIGATIRAGREGAGGHALLYALVGGGSAIAASIAIAAALILTSLQR